MPMPSYGDYLLLLLSLYKVAHVWLMLEGDPTPSFMKLHALKLFFFSNDISLNASYLFNYVYSNSGCY